MSFRAISTIHANSRTQDLVTHEVWDPAFEEFSAAVTEVQRALTELLEDDEAWSTSKGWLVRHRAILTATPVSFLHAAVHTRTASSWGEPCVRPAPELDHLLQLAELSAPDRIGLLERACQLATSLGAIDEANKRSPLASVVGEIRDDLPLDTTFVIPRRRMVDCSRRFLEQALRRSLDETQVVHPTLLRDARPVDCLVFFGPMAWVDDTLLAVPLAPVVHNVVYGWLPGVGTLPTTSHLGDIGGTARPTTVRPRRQRHGDGPSGVRLTEVRASELLPSIDRRHLESAAGSDRSADQLERARTFVLEGEVAVFLSLDGGAQFTLVQDGGTANVVRTPVRDLAAGTFLLLRTEGGGDYVRDVADRKLGDDAPRLRHAQETWKEGLRTLVRETGGYAAASRELQTRAVESASPTNVGRWCSADNITLQSRAEFVALMAALMAPFDAAALYRDLKSVQRAHVAAGTEIRHALLAAAVNVDLDCLRRTGKVDIVLDGVEGGVMTAIRIEEPGPDLDVERGRLGHVFEVQL